MKCEKRKRHSLGKNGFDIMEPGIRCYIILFVSQVYSETYLEKRMINGCKTRHELGILEVYKIFASGTEHKEVFDDFRL